MKKLEFKIKNMEEDKHLTEEEELDYSQVNRHENTKIS